MWRFLFEENALWRKVIRAFYGADCDLNPHHAPFRGSGVWDLFLRLYALDTCQDRKVCDRWCVNDGVYGGTWSWRFPLRGCALNDLEALVSLIGNLSLSVDKDKWSWSRDASGSFKDKTCCNIFQDNALADCSLELHHFWNSLIPRKVNIYVWRASINRFVGATLTRISFMF
ncbi:hypothetical protein Tco_1372940 [Tanacetum coccineum]